MITDLFTGSNQDFGLSAMIATSNAGTKGKSLSDLDGVMSKPANSIDFATLLSQTMDSRFSVDSYTTFTNVDSVMNPSEISSNNLSINSQLKTSFKTDTFNSSPFVNLSERNSFQTSEVKTSKNVSSKTNDTKVATDKKDSTVSKETKKEDTDKSKKVDSKEEDKTQKVDENNNDEKVVEEEVVTEIAMEAETIDEMVSLPEIVEETTVEADISVSEEEIPVEVNMASTTDSEEKTDLREEDENEDLEEVKVSTKEETNPEIFAQNLQNLEQKTDTDDETVETDVEVDFVKTEDNSTKFKMAEKEVKVEDDSDKKQASKEDETDEKVVSEAVGQLQQNTVSEEATVQVASNENVDNEKNKKATLTKEVETTEEVTEVTDDTQDTKVEVSAKDSNEKSNSNQEKDSKLDKAVQEMKKSGDVLPEESLRQKFAEAIGQDKHQAAENADVNLEQQQFTSLSEQAAQNIANSSNAADEAANKIFEALIGKSEGASGKQNQNQNVIGNIEGASKGFAMNQNNGSGMSNGFSFQSGNSQTYNESGKMQQTAHTPTTSFSELLTKAEMVKTKDGAKVMNIELEQEGMGKLELELTSKNGEVTAKLSAENDIAKAKLEELAPQIKENLQEKGVNLTQINVDVSSRDADGNSEKYLRFGKKGKSSRLNGVGSTSVKDVIEEKIIPNLRREALNIQSVDLKV